MFPWIERSAPTELGGPLFIPTQGFGRIDNPDYYDALYMADHAAGAIAETFHVGPWQSRWSPPMLRPRLPGAVTALATFSIDAITLCDLDEPRELVTQALPPSHVITRDRERTQAWALSLWGQHRYHGVRWWSYHEGRWGSLGIWDLEHFSRRAKYEIEPLTLQHPAVQEAADVLSIQL